MKTSTLIRLIFLPSLLLAAWSCVEAENQYKEIPCRPPLEKAVIGPRGLVVYPLSTTDWKSLILLPAANDLRFAVTFDQAEKLWGSPDERGKNFFEYHRPEMRLVVSWSQQRSGGDVFESWYLDTYPARASLADTFHPALLEPIAKSPKELQEIVVIDPVHEMPALRASIENGHVYSLTWHPPPPPAKLPRPTE